MRCRALQIFIFIFSNIFAYFIFKVHLHLDILIIADMMRFEVEMICLLIITLLSVIKVTTSNQAYDYFRALFDNQTSLRPRDMDLITSQIMTNVCFKNERNFFQLDSTILKFKGELS